jgi:hypothetical protein
MTADELAKLIPEEVEEAGATAIFDASPFREREGPLADQSELYKTLTRNYARAALAAGLAAWPEMSVAPIPRLRPYKEAETLQHIILPLKETQNAK